MWRLSPLTRSGFLRCREEIRKVALGVAQNFYDRAAIRGREFRVIPAADSARQNRPESLVDEPLCRRWQRVERCVVDHVAAGIAKQTPRKIQIAQRTSLLVARAF